MTQKRMLVPLGILVGAVVLATGVLMTRTLVAAHHSSDAIVWSQSAGQGNVFPACGSATNLLATCSGNTANFSWGPPGTTESYSYIFYVKDNNTSAVLVNSQNIGNATSYSIPRLYGSSYSWTVAACDAGGCTTPVSGNNLSCTTAPSPPSPLSASCTNNTASLSWGASSGATYYNLYAKDNNSNGVLANQSVGNVTSYSIPRLYGSSYGWTVAACNSAGCSSAASGNDFSCQGSPPPSSLTVSLTQSSSQTTSDGTTGQTFTVSWSSTNATSCTVQKQAPDGVTTNPWATGTSGSKDASPYQIGTHHWWIDCTGAGGTAHQDIYHTVVAANTTPPPNPSSISASCNSAGTQATISWPASSGATDYYPRVWIPSGSCPSGWTMFTDGHTCYKDAYTGGTSIAFATTPGLNYTTWVHAGEPPNWNNPPTQSFTCTPAAPVPTASFTVDGTHRETVLVGSSLNFAWSSTNGTSAHTTVTVDSPDACTPSHSGTYAWGQGNTLSGSYTGYADPCQNGRTYTRVYTVTGSAGSAASATTVVTVTDATCPDNSAAPSGDTSQCTCAQGNTSACAAQPTCPDGSLAPNGDVAQCPPTPGCSLSSSPRQTTPGTSARLSWSSQCSSVSDGCTQPVLGISFPVIAGGSQIDQGVGNVDPNSGSNPFVTVPPSLPITYTLTGRLYYSTFAGNFIAVPNSDYSCKTTVKLTQPKLCSDGSPAPNNDPKQCPKLCKQTGYPTCNASGSSMQYLDASCKVQSSACPWAAYGYGCINNGGGDVSCQTPPKPSATFYVSPVLVRSGAVATVSWTIGAHTTCSISGTNGDGWANLTGAGNGSTSPILGQTVYTLRCREDITDEILPPQSLTVSLVPIFQEK